MVVVKEALTKRGKVSGANDSLGTGRRKTSVARVRVRAGQGAITINSRPLTEYFPNEQDRRQVLTPLELTGRAANVDSHMGLERSLHLAAPILQTGRRSAAAAAAA